MIKLIKQNKSQLKSGNKIPLIKDKQLTEELLLDSEQTFKTIFDNAGDGMLLVDAKGNRYIAANKMICKMLGYSSEEIIKLGVKDIHPKNYLSHALERFNKVSKSEITLVTDIPMKRKDGSVFYANINSVQTTIHGKKYLLGIFRDITERKQAEEALVEREKKLESIFRAAPVGIGLVSNRVLLDVNDRLCEMTGFSKKELIGKNARVLYPTKEDYDYVGREKYRQIKKKGTGTVETRFKCKDGKVINVLLSSTPLNPNDLKAGVTFTALDITERKQAVKALQASEERYRSLIETSPDGIAVTDMKGNFTLVNQKTVELLGYSSEKDLLGMNSVSRVAPEDREYLQKRVELNLKNHIPQSFEQTFIRKDGTRFTAESNSQVLFNENGQVNGFLSIVRDITERKRADKALRESEERFRKLSESSFEGIVISEKGRIRDANKQIAEMLKIKLDELIGMNVIDFVAPESREFVEQHIKSGSEEPYEHLARRKSGSIFPVEVRAKSLPFEGQMFRVTSIRDITEHKQAEEALRIAEGKYRSIFENAVEGIYQTTPDGKFISANPAIAKILGYKSPKELMEKVSNVEKQLYVDVNRRREFRKLIIKHDDVRNFETQLYHKSGKKIWVSLHSRTVRDSKGKIQFYEGTMEDITERKKVEDEIRNSREQFRNLSSHLQSIREEERGVIAREIHDDLGQSLTALKMDVSWLNKHLHKNKEKTQTKINGMNFLISETIRSVQRISSELRPGLLDDLGLSSAIQWYANEFISRTGIKCIVTIDPKEIKLEEKLSIAIYRIFQESLTNVIRHANATKVNVSFTLKKNNLNLVVKDNGIGIQNDLINDSKSLGLIGMQERLYPWNGTVDILGSKGKGTTVKVNLTFEK